MRRLFFTAGERDRGVLVSDHVPTPIHVLRVARERSRVEGRLHVNALGRLADLLFDRSGEIAYAAEGFTTAEGLPALRLQLHGELPLVCQRCLERLALTIDVHRNLVLARDDQALGPSEEDEDTDVIAPEEAGDLTDLLEQELLLSLPMIPRHAEGHCPVPPRVEPAALRELASLAPARPNGH